MVARVGKLSRGLEAGLGWAASSVVAGAVERAFDGGARAVGRGLSWSARSVGRALRCGAHAVHSAGGPSPRAQAAALVAAAPALVEASAGALVGRAATVASDALVLAVAADAARASVRHDGVPGEVWAPIYLAALRTACDEGRCSSLASALASALAVWLEGGARGLPPLDARAVAAALVERAPARFAALPVGAALDALPLLSTPRAVGRVTSRALAAAALVAHVEREAARLLARPAAEVVRLPRPQRVLEAPRLRRAY
jgi:hypothetical protein